MRCLELWAGRWQAAVREETDALPSSASSFQKEGLTFQAEERGLLSGAQTVPGVLFLIVGIWDFTRDDSGMASSLSPAACCY